MIHILVFGNLKDKRLKSLVDEYIVRLHKFPFLSVEIEEFKDKGKEENEKKILEYKTINSENNIYLLDEHAKTYSTQKFKEIIQPAIDQGDEYTFIIGGPEGFSEACKQQFSKISLSPMTFTHEMAQVLLVEQLYRVATIQAKIPYHKD